jgi:acyl-CoA reductase-like NAD-dependent aldehyde dehydrogenase
METLLPQLDYAPAPAETGPSILRARYGLFAGGTWCEANGGLFATVDPATEKRLAEVSRASADDVERAVRAARRGYEKYWRKLRPGERAKHLFRFDRAVSERARELALVQTLDAGTPIRQSRRHDVPQALATLFAYAGWADKLAWAVRAGERTRPLGVVAAFGNGTAPSLEAALALAPALAAGNAAIFVPSEHAPLAALVMAQASLDADLPPGVLSVVTGDARTRAAFLEHQDVDAIASGGTREQCAAIARAVAGSPKRALLRPDASGLLLVCDDAPLDQVIEGIARSVWLERGPFAPDASRLLVQESVCDEVLEGLEERLGTLRSGDPLDENTDCGPLLSRERRDAAEAFVLAALEDGATALRRTDGVPEAGFWSPPTLLHDVRATTLSGHEPCAPVLPLFAFRTVSEALERAAGFGPLGSAGIWTSSPQTALFVAERLRTETVWCNAFGRFDPSAYAAAAGALRTYLNT